MKLKCSGFAIAIIIAIISVFIESCSDSSATKPTPKPTPRVVNKSVQEKLYDLGFTSVRTADSITCEKIRAKYMGEHGVYYFSDREFQNYIDERQLIFGEINRYVGEIPDTCAEQIVTRFERVKNLKRYWADLGKWFDVGSSYYNAYGNKSNAIYIYAPKELFLHENGLLDPIVVVKVDGGWLELARW